MPFAIFALAAINIAIGTQSFVFAGLLTELARDLGVSIGAAGLLGPATSITFAAPSPLATSLVSGFGRKRVMVIGLLALALCNALCAGAFLRLAVRTSYPWRGSDGVCRLAPQRRCDRAGATGERRGRAFAIVLGGLTVALGRAAGIGGGRPFGMARHVRLLGAGLRVVGVADPIPLVEDRAGVRTRAAFAPLFRNARSPGCSVSPFSAFPPPSLSSPISVRSSITSPA